MRAYQDLLKKTERGKPNLALLPARAAFIRLKPAAAAAGMR